MTAGFVLSTSAPALPASGLVHFTDADPVPFKDSYRQDTSRVKASFVRNNLVALGRLGPGAERAVLAAMPEQVRRVLDPQSGLGWIPFCYDVIHADALRAVVGDEACRQWARYQVEFALDGPLIKPLVQSVNRIFGPSPRHFFKMVHRAWAGVTRDAGEFQTLVHNKSNVELVWTDVPVSAFEGRGYLEGLAAFYLGMLDVLQRDGEVRISECDRERRSVRFLFEWSD